MTASHRFIAWGLMPVGSLLGGALGGVVSGGCSPAAEPDTAASRVRWTSSTTVGAAPELRRADRDEARRLLHVPLANDK